MSRKDMDAIGDYELIGKLGEGSQGILWKARALADKPPFLRKDDTVALKILTYGLHQSDRVRTALSHKNIVGFRDAFVWHAAHHDLTCLVMELLEGETLAAIIKRHPKGLPWSLARGIFFETLEALAYAQSAGITHRDVKPSNIFITTDGHVKLIDFDIARDEKAGGTRTVGFRGTFDYMAPDFCTEDESFRGDATSDIFSFGVCFHQALTGKLPFPSFGTGGDFAFWARWQGDPTKHLSCERNGLAVLNKAGRDFAQKCIRKDRSERYASFSEMLPDFSAIENRAVRGKKDCYQFVSFLGAGGFGQIFAAQRLNDGQPVAVKEFQPPLGQYKKHVKRFKKEAATLSQHPHPHLVTYIDFCEIKDPGGGSAFLIMELLPGMPESSLHDRIHAARGKGLDVEEMLTLFSRYLDALQHLHDNQIIHRDIKPANLYAPVGTPEKGKLFDLGIARDLKGSVTVGNVPGTLEYMAPELIASPERQERGNPRSDIYSLGLSFYRALTGRSPYKPLPSDMNKALSDFMARAKGKINYHIEPFTQYPDLVPVVMKAIAVEPGDRYASAVEMRNALLAVLQPILAPEEPATALTEPPLTTTTESAGTKPISPAMPTTWTSTPNLWQRFLGNRRKVFEREAGAVAEDREENLGDGMADEPIREESVVSGDRGKRWPARVRDAFAAVVLSALICGGITACAGWLFTVTTEHRINTVCGRVKKIRDGRELPNAKIVREMSDLRKSVAWSARFLIRLPGNWTNRLERIADFDAISVEIPAWFSNAVDRAAISEKHGDMRLLKKDWAELFRFTDIVDVDQYEALSEHITERSRGLELLAALTNMVVPKSVENTQHLAQCEWVYSNLTTGDFAAEVAGLYFSDRDRVMSRAASLKNDAIGRIMEHFGNQYNVFAGQYNMARKSLNEKDVSLVTRTVDGFRDIRSVFPALMRDDGLKRNYEEISSKMTNAVKELDELAGIEPCLENAVIPTREGDWRKLGSFADALKQFFHRRTEKVWIRYQDECVALLTNLVGQREPLSDRQEKLKEAQRLQNAYKDILGAKAGNVQSNLNNELQLFVLGMSNAWDEAIIVESSAWDKKLSLGAGDHDAREIRFKPYADRITITWQPAGKHEYRRGTTNIQVKAGAGEEIALGALNRDLVSVRLEGYAVASPPAVVSWRLDTSSSDWAKWVNSNEDRLTLAPGSYTFKFERMDYLPCERQIELETGQREVSMVFPSQKEWAPASSAMVKLFAAERGIAGNADTLDEWKLLLALAAMPAPHFEWAGHSNRWEDLLKKLAEVSLNVQDIQNPPVASISYSAIGTDAWRDWGDLTGRHRLAPIEYSFRFRRPDYLDKEKKITVRRDFSEIKAPDPDLWSPTDALQRLGEAENSVKTRAFQKMDALREPKPTFAWPEHSERWNAVYKPVRLEVASFPPRARVTISRLRSKSTTVMSGYTPYSAPLDKGDYEVVCALSGYRKAGTTVALANATNVVLRLEKVTIPPPP